MLYEISEQQQIRVRIIPFGRLRAAGPSAQVGGPEHRESGQVGDFAAARDGEREGADVGGLDHDDQDGAELRSELVEQGPQFGSLLGIRLSWTVLPTGVRPCAWCSPLPRKRLSRWCRTSASLMWVEHQTIPPAALPTTGNHITQRSTLTGRRCAGPRWPSGPSSAVKRCPRPGDTTPRPLFRQGETAMPGPGERQQREVTRIKQGCVASSASGTRSFPAASTVMLSCRLPGRGWREASPGEPAAAYRPSSAAQVWQPRCRHATASWLHGQAA